jgi:predicted nucleic acid-binding protein
MKAMTEIILADTYALVEMLRGSTAYEMYKDIPLVTTKWHLAELYYHLLRRKGKETADLHMNALSAYLSDITNTSITTGMQFRLRHRKEKLSYVDCIGYALAYELGIKLLTGDEKFRNKPNVEFVK